MLKFDLRDHYAHLYGPAAVLVGSGKEQLGVLANNAEPTESDVATPILRPLTPPPLSPTTALKCPKGDAEQLRSAFKNSPYQKVRKTTLLEIIFLGIEF